MSNPVAPAAGSTEVVMRLERVSLEFRRRTLLGSEQQGILMGVDLTLNRGETLGVIGRNGCGKSSLLRVMAGILAPTQGRVEVSDKLSRAVLAIGLGFRNDLSGRDNACLSAMLQGFSKRAAKEMLQKVGDFSELGEAFDRPVSTYSTGMRARLGFSTALINHVDILFIDEVLAVGDGGFREKAAKALKSRIRGDQTVVLVTHNLEEITALCDRVLWLSGGSVQGLGDTHDIAEQYRCSLL
jgi:lipopolysaccharide transport system ATP-binding protein